MNNTKELVVEKELPTANIDAWLEQRDEFIQKVSSKMVEGKDYHVIQGKKSLAKGGAEKIASIFNWRAEFIKDTETLDMLNGSAKGTLAYLCKLTTLEGSFVGEGRGARSLTQDNGDPNKAIKMTQKSAYIDAVIRASGLSDIFTQDLEDMPASSISNGHSKVSVKQPSAPATEKQRNMIKAVGGDLEALGTSIPEVLNLDGAINLDKLSKGQASKVIDTLIKAKESIEKSI